MLKSPLFETQVLPAECKSVFALDGNSSQPVQDESADILQRAIQETSDELEQDSAKFNIHFAESDDITSCREHSPPVLTDVSLENAVNVEETTLVNSSVLRSAHFGHHLNDVDHPALVSEMGQQPIQIIHDGNTFHSTQILTKEQLAQITQVLRMPQMQEDDVGEQHALQQKNNSGQRVAANTRIVYRVIYPSEIYDNSINGNEESDRQQCSEKHNDCGRRRGRPRKLNHQRINEEQEEDCKRPGHRLSKEEREAKKKHHPRTRSGRISKPPTYMVKDYKRIHHLDFDHEPFDDSDGGYSDYQFSTEEDFEVDSTVSLFTTDILMNKNKGYKCTSCDKAYIGKGGLTRHYRLNPTHGGGEELESDSCSNGSSGASQTSASKEQNGVLRDYDKAGDDPKSLASVGGSAGTYELPSSNRRCRDMLKKFGLGRQRKGNKPRLKELLLCYNDEEVKEAALPRLTQTVDVWEFVRRKCLVNNSPHSMADAYQELKKLIDGIRTETRKRLSECHSEKEDGQTYVEIEDQQVANVMGVKVGTYVVKPYLLNGESTPGAKVNNNCASTFTDFASSPAGTSDTVNDSWECRQVVTAQAPDEIGTRNFDSAYNKLPDDTGVCEDYDELLERDVMVTDSSHIREEQLLLNECSTHDERLTSDSCESEQNLLDKLCDFQRSSSTTPISVKCPQLDISKESDIDNSLAHLTPPCNNLERREVGLRSLLIEEDRLSILRTLNNHLTTTDTTFQ